VSAQDHAACLEAENAQLRALLTQTLTLAEHLADRLEADSGPAPSLPEIPEVIEPCRVPLPPRRYARIRGGEVR
jgi:hypothetical protein